MMASIKYPTLVAAVISVVMVAASGFGEPEVVGGTGPVDVKKNMDVQELGKFAVDEYNQQQKSGGGGGVRGPKPSALEFKEVTSAETQVVAGVKYHLKITAAEDGQDKMFDAEVVVAAWAGTKDLVSFKPSQA